jgi:hypothetical protein
MTPFASRLKLLQVLCLVALACSVLGLAGIFVAPKSRTLVLSLLGLGLLAAIVTSSVLAFLNCPSCGKRFCGSQAAGDVAPYPNIFSAECKFCGHNPQV